MLLKSEAYTKQACGTSERSGAQLLDVAEVARLGETLRWMRVRVKSTVA